MSQLQIQELQKEYGGSTEGSEPIKPLARILLEAKQAKDEAFQNQWKQMKQGRLTMRGSAWAEYAEHATQTCMLGTGFPEQCVPDTWCAEGPC